MLQLTYISSVAPALPVTAVGDILKASRRNNAVAGVTGLLLHDGRRFLQALEGEPAMVRQTYERIKADPRHRAVVMLSSQDVDRRAFGDWAMAAQEAAYGSERSLPETIDRLTAEVSDPNMRELFRSFVRIRHAA